MEEIYRGTLEEVLSYLKNDIANVIDNYDYKDQIQNILQVINELENLDYDTEIVLYKNDIVGYHYEIVEEKKTIYDIVKDTQKEFETILSFGAMYGSDTQETRLLTDVEIEILKNYMSVYTSKLIKNIEKFNNNVESEKK